MSIGSVVRLKHNNYATVWMTVERVTDNFVWTVWFVDSVLHRDRFARAALTQRPE